MAEKSSPGTREKIGLVWRNIKKLAKLSIPTLLTLLTVLPLNYFMLKDFLRIIKSGPKIS
jgi:hypothetical protein